MGERPNPPDSLIDEGHDFLNLCFEHNPRDRATAQQLLNHDFVKVGDILWLRKKNTNYNFFSFFSAPLLINIFLNVKCWKDAVR